MPPAILNHIIRVVECYRDFPDDAGDLQTIEARAEVGGLWKIETYSTLDDNEHYTTSTYRPDGTLVELNDDGVRHVA
jgi:hypothetical protein